MNTLIIAGGFIIVSVMVLAVMGGVRSAGARRRRLAALTPMPRVLDSLDTMLLHADEAVRTADQERLFAEAEFGSDTGTRLQRAVTDAQAVVAEAFARREQLRALLDEGQEVQVRQAAQALTDRVQGAVQDLHSAVSEVGSIRDDARHAPVRLERARALHADCEQMLTAARAAVAQAIAEHGPRAADSAPLPEDLLAQASARLQALDAEAGSDASMLTGAQLETLARCEHDLAAVHEALNRAVSLPRMIPEARAALPQACEELDEAIAAAGATPEADPRQRQALAVARQVRGRVGSPNDAVGARDVVDDLADARRVTAELRACLHRAQERFEAQQSSRQQADQRRLGSGDGSLSDSYDPRAGQEAARAGELRWGVLGMSDLGGPGGYDPARPAGIAGPAAPSGGSGAHLLLGVLDEIASGPLGGPGQGRRRRF